MGCTLCGYDKPRPYKSKRMEDLVEDLDTGDVILWSSSSLGSYVNRIATGSPWSHTGMIIKTDYFTPGHPKLYIWHSINDVITCTEDKITGKQKRGVQLNSLKPIIEHSPGEIYIRHMHPKPTEDLFRIHHEFFSEFATKDYEQYVLEMFNAVSDHMLENKDTPQTRETIFCSELNAYTYKEFGWSAPRNVSCNEYLPSDFSSGGTSHWFVDKTFYYLNNKRKWGVETRIE